jgi:hypothetical protein
MWRVGETVSFSYTGEYIAAAGRTSSATAQTVHTTLCR